MITKNIGYAYPSSPLANARGFKQGCWYIAVYDDSKPIQEHDIVFACETKEDVLAQAPYVLGSCSAPWGRWTMFTVENAK